MQTIRRALLLGAALTLLIPAAQGRADDNPPKPADDGGKAIEFKGVLRTGIVAIGGETTGTAISVNGKTYELDFRKSPKLRALAEKLNGKEVVVKGTLRLKEGVEIKERRIIFVTDLRPAEEKVDAQSKGSAETKSFVYKKTTQANLEIVVHYPPDWKETDKRPGIVFFFGGGWTNGTIKSFGTQATHLAMRGMVAACADYRVKSRQGVTPKECVEDAKSAVRWMRQNAAKLGIDPDKIVAAGGSAGGHIAACTAFTPGLEAEGEDLTISSKANALVLFNPVLRFGPQLMQRIGNDEALTKAISPVDHLTKGSPPTLLLFGTADWLLTQGKEFMDKSKALGNKAELFTAEGQQHGFYNRPPWRQKTTQRMDEFLVSIGYLEKPTKEESGQPITIDIKAEKPADRIKMTVDKDSAALDIISQSGIGGATITMNSGKWPATVTLRFHLRGLELLSISNGKIKLSGSVLSHSGNPRLLHVDEDGKEKKVKKDSPYWTEIRVLDASGKPTDGLPGKGGYFEMTLPKALLESQPKSLGLGWIDFYRG
jgi:acetyl esterase